MLDERIMDAMRQMLDNPSPGNPLCGKCGGQHDPRVSECPPKHCGMCGTVHKPNEFLYYTNCERNERFKRKYKESIEWQRKNTAEIWGQSDKEGKEDD